MKRILPLLLVLSAIGSARAQTGGVPISYQLPATPGQTYTVTLAVTDAKNPDWIVSTFLAAAPRTVTAENKGKFTETWDGLDENFMPVPPGDYGVKGIYMPTQKWRVDGEFHSVTPKFAGGALAWLPSPEDWQKPMPFGGDPVGSPLRDVAVGPNGVGVFYYQYLENGLNNPMMDFKKPVGYDQFLRAFNSGGAGGGPCVATDGETVWAFSTDGGPKYVYRADQKSFGKSNGANRSNAYLPAGWVTAMAAWRDEVAKKSFVYIAQRGKIDDADPAKLTDAQRRKMAQTKKRRYDESDDDFVNKITVHDGDDGKVLAELSIDRPQGLAVQGSTLYALHVDGTGYAVSSVKIAAGLPGGTWQRVFNVPADIKPFDLEADSHGRFYLSDTAANKVFQLDGKGKVLRTFGRPGVQKPGGYDPDILMSPGKLATWVDAEGNDRVLIVENAGPNRTAEWSAEGKRLRDFLSLQTKANDGYAVDTEHPEDVYVPGQEGWLTRFKVDYEKRTWTVDAVWPDVGNDPRAPNLQKPQLIRVNGRLYLAGGRSYNVYRLDGDRWLLSTAILQERDGNKWKYSLWHDANGNGKVEDDETTPTELPGRVLTYHGQNWLDDLSFVGMNQGGRDVWRLAPSSFDAHGNPVFKEWTKLLTDPIFEARLAGKADAIHGGNELDEKFPSDWMQTDGTMQDGFYMQARGGRGFSANEGAQYKVSHYAPDGKGGYGLKWRVGRAALQGTAKPGEFYGAMRIHRPINGLVSVIDQSRMGILLYTQDGLYVDTLFPDQRRIGKSEVGLYAQGGEFFAGSVYPNKNNGKVYIALGKYTPLLFEAEGWSLKENPAQRLTTLPKTVTISAAQIAAPPEIALSLRGGAGTAKFARFAPALGGAVLDGSLTGWESVEPIVFQADKDQSVEVRTLYDPDHLYLRWHARLASKFEPKPLPPLERIFTHDQLADTLSFYIQGDVNAKPGGASEGRPGDARFVFGLFKNGDKMQPVGIGMYPEWKGAGSGTFKASPQIYRTPVGQASFAHVGAIAGAQFGYTLDADGKGFVLVAAIPRAAVPRRSTPFDSGLRTLVNFQATFAGHNKFWWANSDGSANRETYDEPSEARLYPGSWAPSQFQGIEGGVVVRNWLVAGPFGGPGMEKFKGDPNGVMPGTNKEMKNAVREVAEAAAYPPDDLKVDLKAVYKGEMIRGYWLDPKEVRWKTASVAELDNRVVLGNGAQVWYAATWIKVPADTELEFQFQGHPQTFLRWFLNGQPVPLPVTDYKVIAVQHLAAAKTLTLRTGWNQVMLRGYCVGYSPFRAGLVLSGAPEKLWNLQLSATPPEQTP
jgi:hypothetical protein